MHSFSETSNAKGGAMTADHPRRDEPERASVRLVHDVAPEPDASALSTGAYAAFVSASDATTATMICNASRTAGDC